MKLLAIISCFLIFSCSGDDENNDPQRQYDYGTITALKNGEQWSAEIHGFDNNGQLDYFGIECSKYNQNGYRREGFTVRLLPKLISSGELIQGCGNGCENPYQCGYRTLSDDGDVICDVYRIVEEFQGENNIEITEYNTQSKEFRGTFRATFAIDEDRTRCDPNAPDTIRFTNGQFHSKITR